MIRWRQWYGMIILAIAGCITALPLKAQSIAVVRPDVAAPGMSVVVEVLAKASLPGYFSFADGFAPSNVSCFTLDPGDSTRLKFGPLCVSWNGRLLQIPVYVTATDQQPGHAPIVIRGQNAFDTVDFRIVLPQQIPTLSGKDTLGQGALGNFSPHNTLVVDRLDANGATIAITPQAALEPITILSRGPITLTKSTISVRANGVDAGPGGGGGGHGYQGEGGAGFTGGGNSGVRPPSGNIGSEVDSEPTVDNGGQSLTGVLGGGSEPDKDQGGGGGTGCPYGTSGKAGVENASSPPGGYGGGSGGGEATQINLAYGGGGGAFGTDGTPGAQTGASINNGLKNGGRFLIPFQGGSGGGAGNSEGTVTGAGNGGAGGGAIALIGFDSVSLQGSSVNAEGDSGTTGAKNTAGGGGGSGGAVLVASNVQLSATGFGVRINGGVGGQGGQNQYAGGGGGFGRMRLDGGNPSVNIPLTNIASSVISVQKPATRLVGDWMKLSGFAPDTANETDSIRIYYRTNRIGWIRVDTVRDRSTGRWSKWLPRRFDSLLLVATCIKVNTPSTAFANLEPDWAISHAGLMIYAPPDTPHLVILDTLSFGSERVGACKTLKLLVKNDGNDTLRVDSIKVGGRQYTAAPSSKFRVPPYSADTLSVTFCPDTATTIFGSLQLFTNDGLASPKHVVLIGTGTLKNDSLLVSPSSVRFDRVVVGHCDSALVTLRSAGKDTVDLLASSWNRQPFGLDLKPSDTLLAPGDSVIAVVHFCPTDSGDYSDNFEIDLHGDNIQAAGHAVIRKLAITKDTALGSLCAGHELAVSIPIESKSNDTVSIVGVTSTNPNLVLQSPALPHLMPPHGNISETLLLTPSLPGSVSDTIVTKTADSSYTTILRYHVNAPLLALDTALDFGAVCVGLRDSVSFSLRNFGLDSLRYAIDTNGIGSSFTLLSTDDTLPPSESKSLRFEFAPNASAAFRAQVRVRATVGGCDSSFTFVLKGTGSTGELAASDLTFDTTVVGACVDDSMLVQNPCGPPVTLNGLTTHNPFQYLDSGLQTVTVPAGGSVMLHFRFCPDSSGAKSDTITIGTVHAVLRGVGKDTTRAWAAFKISNANIIAGELGATAMTFDSSSLKGPHAFRVNLLYDPTVVWPERADPAPGHLTAEGVYSFDTTIDFSIPSQFLDVVGWRGLIGPKESTVVTMTVTPDTLFDVRVRPGKITVVDCQNLSGKVTVSGPYILHALQPSIASSDATVRLELGNSGRAVGEIWDMTGRHIATVLDKDLDRGVYDIPLKLQSLSSGRYMFVARSLGWQGMTPFIIER